jgi:hypothetical protein
VPFGGETCAPVRLSSARAREAQPAQTTEAKAVPLPRGNITGQAYQETGLSTKRLELLKEAVPQLARLAVLWHAAGSDTHVMRAVEDATQAVRLALHVQEVREPSDLERAVGAATTWGAQALLQLASPFFTLHRQALGTRMQDMRIQVMLHKQKHFS